MQQRPFYMLLKMDTVSGRGSTDDVDSSAGLSTSVSYSFTSFKLPVTFPVTELFHTGRPHGYRSGQPLSRLNRWFLPVEEVVKLHFSVKARSSQEAAVVLCFPIDLQHKRAPARIFFKIYNNLVQQQLRKERKSINCALSPSRPSAQVPESQ